MAVSPLSLIHPTAVIDPSAQIDSSVEVGAYCIVGPKVRIGAGTKLYPHVVLDGRTTLGRNNVLYPGACLGFPPQARPIHEGTQLIVGDDNIIREHVTMHTGLKEPGTRVGNRCYFMASSHVGHDSQVADDVTLANSAALGGHVVVEEKVMIGGLVGVHQFVRIGKFAMVGGVTKPTQDVLPYTIVEGRPGRLVGVNLIGLRRNQFSAQSIKDIRRAVRLIQFSGAKFRETIEQVRQEFAANADVQHLVRFIESSKRGVVRRRTDHPGADEA